MHLQAAAGFVKCEMEMSITGMVERLRPDVIASPSLQARASSLQGPKIIFSRALICDLQEIGFPFVVTK